MIIIFAGALGRFPVGGHAWAELNFILGLQALGHTVYFLEDCWTIQCNTSVKLLSPFHSTINGYTDQVKSR